MNDKFDVIINRRGTDSYKWDLDPHEYNTDIIPMWVADMDFECPPEIKAALQKRVAHGIFGYTRRSKSYTDAILNWISRRYHWAVKPEWLAFCPPGIIPAVYALIRIKTGPGDRIILHTPAYGPLKDVIQDSGRTVLETELSLEQSRYAFDLAGLEKTIDAKTRMMILCSPHNPTGRVWERKELHALGEICRQHDIFIVSDDAHADIVYPGHTYIPLASTADWLPSMTATCYSPGKTFNIGGLQTSTLVIPDPETRHAYETFMTTLQMRLDNLFSAAALGAGYAHGEQWLNNLLLYLEKNRDFLLAYVDRHLPGIRAIKPQGTFLVWLDVRDLNLSSRDLKTFMLEKAGVLPSFGEEYGRQNSGFIRLNIACPKIILKQGLERLRNAVQALPSGR